jgi:hypothetical protein
MSFHAKREKAPAPRIYRHDTEGSLAKQSPSPLPALSTPLPRSGEGRWPAPVERVLAFSFDEAPHSVPGEPRNAKETNLLFSNRTRPHRLCRHGVTLLLLSGIATLICAQAASATTTISNRTVRGARIPRGAHDRVYRHVTFLPGSSGGGVLEITKSCHDITFRDCVIASGPWNGISINDSGGNIRRIRFVHCRIKPQGRMGFECTTRGSSTAVFQKIALIDCVFSPQGNEAISFDGPNGVAANCLIDNVVIRGAGNDPQQPFGSGLEINGPTHMTIRRLTIYRTRDIMLNLQGFSPSSRWRFIRCRFDASRSLQATQMTGGARVMGASGMNGAIFSHCVFNAGGTSGAYNNGRLYNSSGNDFRTSQFRGANDNAGLSFAGTSMGNMLP